MAFSLSHNKKRNVGLVFEFLIRRLSMQFLSEDREGFAETFAVVKRHFSSGSLLARERALFETIRGVRGASEGVARSVLSRVKEHARRTDSRLLEIKKSALIKDVNHTFGRDFFKDHRVPEYRLLASIQMVIDGCRSRGALSEDVERVKLEEGLVLYMTTVTVPPSMVAADSVDSLSLHFAEQSFDKRYGASLNEDQRKLLFRYARSHSSDDRPLRELLDSELQRIAEKIDGARKMKEFKDDKVMAERLDEAVIRLFEVPDMPVDGQVQEVLLFQKLVEELESKDE